LHAKVKSVLSGDTVILAKLDNPKQERTLSLAFVSSPRLRREGDEVSRKDHAIKNWNWRSQPFAFQSREFLRRSLVGRAVLFKPLYTIPSTKREYGLVVVPKGGPQFPERAVSEGTVRLRDDASRKDESEEAARLLERLEVAEARAKADEKGVWSESGGKVDCSYEVQDAKALLETNKGKVLDGVCRHCGH
jgi:staphylococcal nuclease domain-containing protein 1